jgi:hypothetical protein
LFDVGSVKRSDPQNVAQLIRLCSRHGRQAGQAYSWL